MYLSHGNYLDVMGGSYDDSMLYYQNAYITGRNWEQPIFTTKAHVFHIDPNTKKKWLPTSPQAVHVSYYYDSTRNTYRIISVDGSKAVINSTITPTMQFTKTSQKFGQWSDQRANTVYGLGFSSEAELSKFIEKFREVKELTRQAAEDSQTNGVDAHDHVSSDTSGSPSDSPKPPLPPNISLNDTSGTETNNSRSNSPSHPSSSQVEQLRYENDRLKIALAQSSANAKKWEVELQTLKNNNARLTTALQESTTNVEEWKKQLAAYKEENARLKKKVLETDKSSGAGSELLQRQLTDTREKLQESGKTIEDKDKEILELSSRLEDVKSLEVQNQSFTDKIQNLESERDVLRKQLEDLRQQVDSSKTSNIREKQQLRSVQERLGNKLKELQELHAEIADVTQQNR